SAHCAGRTRWARHNDPLRDGSQSALAISAPGFAPNPRWPGNRASRTARPPRRSPAPWTNDGASLGPGGDRKSAKKTRGANASARPSVSWLCLLVARAERESRRTGFGKPRAAAVRSEEHTSELQSRG